MLRNYVSQALPFIPEGIKLCKIAFQCLTQTKNASACPLAKGDAPLSTPSPIAFPLMKKMIAFQVRQRILRLLDRKNGELNLQKLKRARYMREAYLRDKKRLNLTFSLADFRKIQQHAQVSGLTPTAFLRHCTLAYLKDERVTSQKAENTLLEWIFLLRNISNNMNQIAKQANTLQKVALGDFVQLKILIQQLEETAEKAIKQLN